MLDELVNYLTNQAIEQLLMHSLGTKFVTVAILTILI
jgi:hypothetical protein